MSLLVVVALFASSWRRGLAPRQKRLLVALAGLGFVATTLSTTLSVFLLPIFWLFSLVEDSGKGVGRIPSYAIFIGAFGLGICISWFSSPAATVGGYANILHPLLGSRWLANGLWLGVVSLLLAVFWPRSTPSLLRRFDLTTPGGVVVVVWLEMMILTGVYGLIVPSQFIFSNYLLWVAGHFLFLAALFLAAESGKLQASVWVLFGVMSLSGSWMMVRDPAVVAGSDRCTGLQPVLEYVEPDDLLLVSVPKGQKCRFQVPLDVAGLAQVQVYKNEGMLKSRLGDQETVKSYDDIWVLLGSESKWPWLETLALPSRGLVKTGQAGCGFILHRFVEEHFPRPITVFSQKGNAIAVHDAEGLFAGGVWTGPSFKLMFDLDFPCAEILEITLKGWRPQDIETIVQKLVVTINGTTLKFQQSQKTMIIFQIPPDTLQPLNNTLEIHTPVFAAKDDDRNLGLDLDSIILR